MHNNLNKGHSKNALGLIFLNITKKMNKNHGHYFPASFNLLLYDTIIVCYIIYVCINLNSWNNIK